MRQCKVCMIRWSPLPICPQCQTEAIPEMLLRPSDETAYAQYIDALQALADRGRAGLLTPRQRGQLLAARSNAAFLERRLRYLEQEHRSGNLRAREPVALQRWQTSMNALIESLLAEAPPGSVFTRDIDQAELVGQSRFGATMSATYRIPRGIGRIRNAADFNRGGAVGTYVRFLSSRSRNRAAGAASQSAPLAIGSIGNSGITLVYDALSVVLHNAAPAHFFHNGQDSAGRIFGTAAIDPQALRRQSRISERVLGRANPTYWRAGPPGVPTVPLGDDYILDTARTGLILLTLQVREGQTDREEYNEQVLLDGVPLTAIKAIFIHRPAVTPGRPPERQQVPEERVQRLRARLDTQRANASAALAEIREERAELERAVLELRATRQWRRSEVVTEDLRSAHARISELVVEEARLGRAILVQRAVHTERWVPRMEPRTDRIVRGRAAWEDEGLPASLGALADKVGLDGVPIRFLVRHVNPQAVRREALPALAAEVHARGRVRWQQTLESA